MLQSIRHPRRCRVLRILRATPHLILKVQQWRKRKGSPIHPWGSSKTMEVMAIASPARRWTWVRLRLVLILIWNAHQRFRAAPCAMTSISSWNSMYHHYDACHGPLSCITFESSYTAWVATGQVLGQFPAQGGKYPWRSFPWSPQPRKDGLGWLEILCDNRGKANVPWPVQWCETS